MLRISQLERALTFQKAMGQGLDGKLVSPSMPRNRSSSVQKQQTPKNPKKTKTDSVNSVPAMRAKNK